MPTKTRKKRTARADGASRITPYLLYEDVGAMLGWLAKAFGLREIEDRFTGPDGRIQHAAMEIAPGSAVMMGWPGPQYKNPKKLGQSTQMLYISVDDADAHYKKAKKAGAKILEKPQNTFYGHRRYGAEDPEGHQWYFAHEITTARGPKKPAAGG